jgi:hypothetical protein
MSAEWLVGHGDTGERLRAIQKYMPGKVYLWACEPEAGAVVLKKGEDLT